MTAKVFLDDPFQTFSKAQIEFLKLAVRDLPSCVRLRAASGSLKAFTSDEERLDLHEESRCHYAAR